jgi:NAD(P)H-dependent FMN reductase
LTLELPLLDKMWKEIKRGSDINSASLREKLEPLADLYERADGFVVVSGEYNHSVPPGLSNLLDYFIEEYLYRPSAIVCYSAGGYGGVRAAMQLRAMLPELGMSSIPSIQAIPKVGQALSADGIAVTQELAERSGPFFDEFDWYMAAMKAGRAIHDPRTDKA